MTVFRTFLKVLNKCKMPIILYTVILIFFGGFNIETSDSSISFAPSKPDVFIINHDEEIGITKSLIEYITKNCNIISVSPEKLEDALFYRDINYIIEIPVSFRQDFLKGKNPKILVKSTGDYQASLAEMLLERYMRVASTYQLSISSSTSMNISEEELISNIEDTLKTGVEVKMTSKLDNNSLSKATTYYNFTNYCILAGCIYVICLILSIFKEEKIKKRTIISSMSYREYNRKLLLSNSLFAIVLWIFYVLLSFILVGNIMFTMHGFIYIINSFLFTLCAVTIAFLIGNILTNKNAINGLVNVIALGSSFLCGAFVPMEWLPDMVLKIAHILPSYWYIKTNELVKKVEVFNRESMLPMIGNMIVVLLFILGFMIITNMISKRKRKLDS